MPHTVKQDWPLDPCYKLWVADRILEPYESHATPHMQYLITNRFKGVTEADLELSSFFYITCDANFQFAFIQKSILNCYVPLTCTVAFAYTFCYHGTSSMLDWQTPAYHFYKKTHFILEKIKGIKYNTSTTWLNWFMYRIFLRFS